MKYLLAAAFALACGAAHAQSAKDMSFFVTSAGPGKGADLGGIKGADAQCQALAKAAGAGNKTWHAYLSESPSTNARDRIGKGPWKNAKGEVVAKDVEDLHKNPNINKQTALTEKGATVNGRGDTPNMHDMLTGSSPDGRALPADKGDTTCGNWTKSGEGSAIVGHHDRTGLNESAEAKSWNSSHPSKGCSQDSLKGTGGNGYFYCFAAN